MINNPRLKLVAVMDFTQVILYEAQGLKISKKLEDWHLAIKKHIRPLKSQSSYQKMSGPGSTFEPHTMPKELDHQDSAKAICHHLEQIFNLNQFVELIVVAEPRLLGYIRQYLSDKLQKLVTREIHKDLVDKDSRTIEHAVFS